MRLLVLHNLEGEPVYINPPAVVAIETVETPGMDATGSILLLDRSILSFRESAAAIARYWEREQHLDRTGRYPRQDE